MMIRKQNIKSFVRRVEHYGLLLPLSNIFLNYSGSFFSDSLRRKISSWRSKKIERKILDTVGPLPPINAFEDQNSGLLEDEKIWVLWLQGESQMPSIPRMCYASIVKNSCGHEVVLLTKDNLRKYINIDNRILSFFEKGIITPSHFSDILRMELLGKYGGFWIDATMYLVRPLSPDAFNLPFYTNHTENFGGLFVSDYRWATFYLSIRKACKLARAVSWIFNEYWKKSDCLIDYFMFDHVIDIVYKHYPEIRSQIDGVPLNNPQIHSLSRLLINPFDANEFNRLTSKTDSFKLSWKAFTNEQLESTPDNYYHFLRELSK